MREQYLIDNPNFAYKLFSTVGMGSNNMTSYEEELCKDIWMECNNNRSQVLIKCVQICGSINTPLARYVRAKAWSWNLVKYSSNAIDAINDYLRNELYEDAFKNNLAFDNYIMRKNQHLFRMYLDLAKAYEGDKQFDKAIEIYNESKKYMNNQIPYVSIAERYRKMKRFDEALRELEKAKNSEYAIYPNENEPTIDHINNIDLNIIDRYYNKILESKRKYTKD